MKIVLTKHARFESLRRQIPQKIIEKIINESKQKIFKENYLIIQGKYFDKIIGKEMLLRIIAEIEGKSLKVITVYKTSKIKKYMKKE